MLRHAAGDKATVVAAGVTLFEALKAADLLKAEGIGITVVDAYSIKPLAKENDPDRGAHDPRPRGDGGGPLRGGRAGRRGGGRTERRWVRVHKLAVTELPRSGKADQLLAKYGINADAIVRKVKSLP